MNHEVFEHNVAAFEVASLRPLRRALSAGVDQWGGIVKVQYTSSNGGSFLVYSQDNQVRCEFKRSEFKLAEWNKILTTFGMHAKQYRHARVHSGGELQVLAPAPWQEW